MLFPKAAWAGLHDGTITLAFRRWKRPTVKAGGTLQTPGGLLAIDEVARIDPEDIAETDARTAGHDSRAAVLAALRPEGDLYRIRFHRLGDDPRAGLREQAALDPSDAATLRRALGRTEWAIPVLQLIAQHPGVVSTELAGTMGMERLPFKQRVRRLKSLGLTESLKVGYRISPRGRALLALLEEGTRRKP